MKTTLFALLVLLCGLALKSTALAQSMTPPPQVGTPQPDDHQAAPQAPQADTTALASDLPPGTIVVNLVDAQEKPKPNVTVRLSVLYNTVAEGESRSEIAKPTDVNGIARFDALNTGQSYSYQVSAEHSGARRSSEPVQLRADMGLRVTMHLYPVTRNIKDTLVGMRTIVYIEPRDDVFQFDVFFQIYNMGRVTWAPEGLVVQLPQGYKAFTTQEQMSEIGVVDSGNGARLTGTLPPGQHDVSFRFQVPNEHEESARFRMSLPPHVAELRVITESAQGMTLASSGFAPARISTNQNGQRIQIIEKQLTAGQHPPDEVLIDLNGIPVPGSGRWLAVVIAIALCAGGVAAAARKTDGQQRGLPGKDLERARTVLLNELVALENARKDQTIGPKMYQRTRQTLIDGLVRLGVQEPPAASTRRRPRSAGGEARAAARQRPAQNG